MRVPEYHTENQPQLARCDILDYAHEEKPFHHYTAEKVLLSCNLACKKMIGRLCN